MHVWLLAGISACNALHFPRKGIELPACWRQNRPCGNVLQAAATHRGWPQAASRRIQVPLLPATDGTAACGECRLPHAVPSCFPPPLSRCSGRTQSQSARPSRNSSAVLQAAMGSLIVPGWTGPARRSVISAPSLGKCRMGGVANFKFFSFFFFLLFPPSSSTFQS